MERGQLRRDAFMREIVEMTQHIVGQAKGYGRHHPGRFRHAHRALPKMRWRSPRELQEIQCQSCTFGFWKIMGGRQLEVKRPTLLREHKVGPLEGFRSRLGRPFTASIKLTDANE
jgi:DNA topoisomerase-3